MSDYINGIHRLANIAGNLMRGKNCRIDAFVTITGDVVLGDNVHISTGACLFGGSGRIEIGDGTSISPGAKIFTATEDVDAPATSNPQVAVRAMREGPITIGRNCVIGANAVVLPRNTFGDETVVGAQAVVTYESVDGAVGVVLAGVPAKQLRLRHRLLP